MGTVTLSTQAPMVGTAITATLTDDDGGVTGQMWQWQKSMTPMDMNSWMDITGAMAMSYTPAAMDVGYHLRAKVTYTDANSSDRMVYSDATTGAVMLPSDRMGTVTLSTQEPAVGMAITATLMDADGTISGQMWQWQKSMTLTDMDSWMDIAGATATGTMTSSYTPAAADVDYHLRATVTYTDAYRSGRTAYSATDNDVDEDAVLARFDADDNGMIDRSEAVDILRRYLAEDGISRPDAIAVLRHYLSN